MFNALPACLDVAAAHQLILVPLAQMGSSGRSEPPTRPDLVLPVQAIARPATLPPIVPPVSTTTTSITITTTTNVNFVQSPTVFNVVMPSMFAQPAELVTLCPLMDPLVTLPPLQLLVPLLDVSHHHAVEETVPSVQLDMPQSPTTTVTLVQQDAKHAQYLEPQPQLLAVPVTIHSTELWVPLPMMPTHANNVHHSTQAI